MEKRMEVSPVLERHIVRMEVRYVNGVREETVWVPDNADEEKAHLNRELVARIAKDEGTGKTKNLTIQQAVNRRIQEAGIGKVRSNQNRCIEIIFSGSPETMCAMSQGQVSNWANDTLAWAQDRWGYENVVSATLHCDEKTPHIHMIVVPIVQGQSRRSASQERTDAAKGVDVKKYKTDTTKNRLCANEVYTQPLLYGYHTSYAEAVGQKYGLSRGVRAELGSYKKHTTSIEYNRQLEEEAVHKERLISELTADYVKQEAEVKSHISKMIARGQNIGQKVRDVEAKIEELRLIQQSLEHQIRQREEYFANMFSFNFLNALAELPKLIHKELQGYISEKFPGELVDYTCQNSEEVKLRMRMPQNSHIYSIVININSSQVWVNQDKNPQGFTMPRLASFFREEIKPEAMQMLSSLYKRKTGGFPYDHDIKKSSAGLKK